MPESHRPVTGVSCQPFRNHRRFLILTSLLPLFTCSGWLTAQESSNSPVSGTSAKPHAVIVTVLNEDNWDELVPAGKEIDAIYGDFVLQN